VIKVLSENDEYHQKSRDYGFASTEYFYVPIDNGDSLNAYMMKPVDFEENKNIQY
jgi:dipeptidyl aminopeptidase/acylaminoacyl peptidase